MPRLIVDSPASDTDIPETPPVQDNARSLKFLDVEADVRGDTSGDDISSVSKSDVSNLLDDQEDVSDDITDGTPEKKYSPPDNLARPTKLEDISPARILDVSYEDKDEAKRTGAWWAPKLKKWYVPRNMSVYDFKKWWSRDTRRAMAAAKGGRNASTTSRGGGDGSSRPADAHR